MASIAGTYKIRKFPKDTMLNVTIVETREYKLRVWVAKRLICLAAWVLGCGIKVESENA